MTCSDMCSLLRELPATYICDPRHFFIAINFINLWVISVLLCKSKHVLVITFYVRV